MPVIATEGVTLVDSLQFAFRVESNAYARYAAYAVKSKSEGWLGVSSLFRAAARAEHIHAGNHGRILHHLGGQPDYTVDSVAARTTLENLKFAVTQELYEVNTLLPELIAKAQAFGDIAVTRTFRWSLEAEKTHARLFNEATALVEHGNRESWAVMIRDFHICPVCGYTSEFSDQAGMCPTCHCAWKRFEVIQ